MFFFVFFGGGIPHTHTHTHTHTWNLTLVQSSLLLLKIVYSDSYGNFTHWKISSTFSILKFFSFWGHLYYWDVFIIGFYLIFEVIFILESSLKIIIFHRTNSRCSGNGQEYHKKSIGAIRSSCRSTVPTVNRSAAIFSTLCEKYWPRRKEENGISRHQRLLVTDCNTVTCNNFNPAHKIMANIDECLEMHFMVCANLVMFTLF